MNNGQIAPNGDAANAGMGAQVFHETNVPSWHPFLRQFWNGTCDEGQLTKEGMEDAVRHGKVSVMTAVGTGCVARGLIYAVPRAH